MRPRNSMGNIFKTLGIDDLVRSIPVVGKVAGDFLSGIPLGQKSGPGANSGNILDAITSNTGPTQGRISNEDYQFNQDLLDSSNPREIARTGNFLEGVAPSQANAYNTYQDQTYQADTDRAIGRTQQTGEALGMSPWEVMGLQGATPLPAGPISQPKASGEGFLSQMTPLAIAKMQNKTTLDVAKMNNETALQQTAMQTGNAMDIAKYGQEGPEATQRIAESAARILLQEAQTAKTFQDTEAQAQNMIVQVVTTALNSLPVENLSIGGYTRTQRQGAAPVLRQLATRGQGTYDADKVRQWLKGFNQNEMSQLADDLRWWGKYSQGADMLGKVGGIANNLSGAFLKGMTGASKYTHELKDFH